MSRPLNMNMQMNLLLSTVPLLQVKKRRARAEFIPGRTSCILPHPITQSNDSNRSTASLLPLPKVHNISDEGTVLHSKVVVHRMYPRAGPTIAYLQGDWH